MFAEIIKCTLIGRLASLPAPATESEPELHLSPKNLQLFSVIKCLYRMPFRFIYIQVANVVHSELYLVILVPFC
jgi:hypothetical protein